jgi:hypothetical protein
MSKHFFCICFTDTFGIVVASNPVPQVLCDSVLLRVPNVCDASSQTCMSLCSMRTAIDSSFSP